MYKKILILFGFMLSAVSPAYATDKYTIDGDNYNHTITVYNEGEYLKLDDQKFESPFTIEKKYLAALDTAAQKWASVLQTSAPKPMAGYAIFSEDDYNASAMSPYVQIKESPYPVTFINAMINKKTVIEDEDDGEDLPEDINGFIFIGYGLDKSRVGWQPFSGLHSLYHNYELPDMHTVMLHEIMHSLGITTDVSKQREETDKNGYYFTEKDEDNLSVFDRDLRVYAGNAAEPFDINKEVVPNSTMKVGKNEDFDIFTYSPYYVGDTTIKTLGGNNDYATARAAIVANGGLTNYSSSYASNSSYPKVFGMPIHNADGGEEENDEGDDDDVDLSHLELRNSYMSHQMYRNWMVPMEAELAVLKDVGYKIDLRKFYGKSYYLNNITDTFSTGYSAWNGSVYTNEPSDIAQGVGLHIYGNNNNITQTSDIATNGEGSFGVRIDGVNNTYTLAKGNKIAVNGKENLGIAATWGKNHIINIEQESSVIANGEQGIAVSLDFGENFFGSLDDTRGSYANYNDTYSLNLDPTEEIDEAMVKQVNIAGKLTGSIAAVYISDKSHVEEVNILPGAQINGNIISEWNSVLAGRLARVKRKDSEGKWHPVDGRYESQLYFTNINIDANFNGTINGNIYGETFANNTLKLNNYGNTNFNGNILAVYALNNEGSINVDSAKIFVQNGLVAGDGELDVSDEINIGAGITQIDNTINLQNDAIFSTINNEIAGLQIAQLNAENAFISFDLGDTYALKNASLQDKAAISQIKFSKENADILGEDVTFDFFGDENKALDLGDSYANVYYNGKKYYITQDTAKKNLLHIKMSAEKISLHEAAEDETTANYIVTEDKQTEDIGTVRGDYFEISGNDIDANGYSGMIIDKQYNPEKTVLKTGIFGAKGSNICVVNGGNVEISAQDKNITFGKTGETAAYLQNGSINFIAADKAIIVNGAIVGTDNENNLLKASGNSISFSQLENVDVDLKTQYAFLNDTVQYSSLNVTESNLSISDDAFLAAANNNKLALDNATLDLRNGQASAINLVALTLNNNVTANIDIDLNTLTADHFAVEDKDDLIADNANLRINNINLLNQNSKLTAEKINIPFVSAADNTKNLLEKVDIAELPVIVTPIFKYNFGYAEDEQSGNFVLSRGNTKQYKSYNPAIMAAPVATLGGYLTQLNSYDEAFNDNGKHLATPSYNINGYTQDTVMPDKKLWIRPSSSFEKVDLRHGPEFRDNMYNLYAGVDSATGKIFKDWNARYGVYAGYNYSRQKYSGNKIRQHGGTIGVMADLEKNSFFNMSTLSAGTDRAEASTMYGKEHFYLFRYGLANKTGYNWHTYNRKLLLQPNLLMSYTFVKATNYHNAAQVSVKSHPLHALNVAPGLTVAGDLANGWRPYADVKMVWNVMNKTQFEAQHIDLPEASVKPYVQYGFGVQKDVNSALSAYGQLNFLSGGRSGTDIAAGIRWSF